MTGAGRVQAHWRRDPFEVCEADYRYLEHYQFTRRFQVAEFSKYYWNKPQVMWGVMAVKER
jgi:hypothetical protein